MKKLFTILAVAATLVSCAKEDVVREAAREAIGFDNAFVENSTRSVNDPSLTAASLNDFAVFGFVEGNTLFDGTKVTKGTATDENGQTSTVWTYTDKQYWIAGAKYNFNAVAPYTNGGWTKTAATKDATTLSFTNNGTTDLLYAYAAQEGKVSGNTAVAFTFRHVLSKVKFSFENAYNATNATIRVKDITITNPHKTANAVLSSTTVWSDLTTDSAFTLNFGMASDNEGTTDAKENVEVAYANNFTYESQNELFLIPSATAYDYNVTFTVELLVSGSVVATYQHTATAAFAPEAGKAYDIKTTITAKNIDPNNEQEPIEFTVTSIDGWGTTNNEEADGDYDPTPQQ